MVIIVVLTNEEFELLKSGDRGLYVRFYGEYKRLVYHVILARVSGDTESAQDILQDTFLSAMSCVSRLKNPGHIPAWIVTIAKNKVVDHLRKRGRAAQLLSKIRTEPTESTDIAESLEQNERAALLGLGMERLNAVYREILRMKCWDNMPVEKIAEKTQRTPKAVENILYRARDSLKREIERLSGGVAT